MRLKIRIETPEDEIKAAELSKKYSTILFDNYLLIDTSIWKTNCLNLDDFINEPIMWRFTLNILYHTQLLEDKKTGSISNISNILNILVRILLLITLICLIYPFRTYWLLLIALGIEIYNLIKTIWKN